MVVWEVQRTWWQCYRRSQSFSASVAEDGRWWCGTVEKFISNPSLPLPVHLLGRSRKIRWTLPGSGASSLAGGSSGCGGAVGSCACCSAGGRLAI